MASHIANMHITKEQPYLRSPLLQQAETGFLNSFFSVEKCVYFDLTHLLAALTVKFFMTIVAMSLPVPLGCMAPFLVIGALVGRLVARFALIGAVAFAAGGLRAFSVIAIIIELIFLPGLSTELILASFVSIFLSVQISDFSILDSIVLMKGLPCMPTSTPGSFSQRTVTECCVTQFVQVPRFTTYCVLWGRLREACGIKDDVLPIVSAGALVGIVATADVRAELEELGLPLEREKFEDENEFQVLLKQYNDYETERGKMGEGAGEDFEADQWIRTAQMFEDPPHDDEDKKIIAWTKLKGSTKCCPAVDPAEATSTTACNRGIKEMSMLFPAP
eukprot:g16372.t1